MIVPPAMPLILIVAGALVAAHGWEGADMFSVELTLKIAGRAVSFDEFVDAVLARSLASVQQEIEWVRSIPQPVPPPPPPLTQSAVERKSDDRAVGIERAAELLGLSSATIRKYVRLRKLHAVRFGRRVLIPIETVERVLREGLPSRSEVG
jgi:excisionase family DNA binding protein